jgi:hypothetical protein
MCVGTAMSCGDGWTDGMGWRVRWVGEGRAELSL